MNNEYKTSDLTVKSFRGISKEVTLKRIRVVEKDLKYITVQFIGGSSNG